ncbi:hypothetical protein CH380_02175, partial [Leptospira adleri]
VNVNSFCRSSDDSSVKSRGPHPELGGGGEVAGKLGRLFSIRKILCCQREFFLSEFRRGARSVLYLSLRASAKDSWMGRIGLVIFLKN